MTTRTLHPSFPTNDKQFMALWDQVDLSQWDGKAGEPPTAVKKEFTYADLATGDDEMRAKAIDWLKAHAKDAEPVLHVSLLPQGAQPEQPLPALEGEVSRRRQLSRLPDGARRQFGPSRAGDP